MIDWTASRTGGEASLPPNLSDSELTRRADEIISKAAAALEASSVEDESPAFDAGSFCRQRSALAQKISRLLGDIASLARHGDPEIQNLLCLVQRVRQAADHVHEFGFLTDGDVELLLCVGARCPNYS
jgi:hypothetical protein